MEGTTNNANVERTPNTNIEEASMNMVMEETITVDMEEVTMDRVATPEDVEGARCGCPRLTPDVTLTGAARDGRRKPPIDHPVVVIDHPDAYTFTVDLPATGPYLDNRKFHISHDGTICVEGTVTSGDATEESSTAVVLNRRIRRLSPDVPFSISFSLPGPIDVITGEVWVRPQGVLKVLVKKAS